MSRSLIAGANAWFRAKERTRRDRVLDDPYAEALAERDARVLALRFARFAIPPLHREIDRLQTAHCVRHRAIDELVLRAVERDGARQLVVLGAGYDMRARRFERRLRGARVLEIDHPDTQARKLARLPAAGLDRDGVARVGCDLDREPLARALDRAGFDASVSTTFVLEGLIHYLSPASFARLLDDARGPGGAPRRIVASFIRDDVVGRESAAFRALILAVREIPYLYFAPDALARTLAEHGFPSFARWTFEAQRRAFAPHAVARRVGVAQDVFVADSRAGLDLEA